MQATNRTTHDVQQGTGAWLRLRERFCTASEAPAALGVSKYVTRAELLRRKHLGIDAEPDAATLGRFEAGHAAEALARPMAETFIDAELYPVTMSAEVDGLQLLASLDGQTMDDCTIWETKLWNEELAADVRAGTLDEHYLVQMDQELLVSGAQRCLFTCTDGTPERFVSCWHYPSAERFERVVAGWRQFERDLAAYVLPESAPAAPVGKAPDTLPALRIEVQGRVAASNLAEFRQTALTAIRSVNRELTTDQHFADAEKAVKWCGEVESKLKAAKEHALSQTADIDALFKALDDIGAEAKAVRLDLDRLVTRRKQEVKEEAVAAARKALDLHILAANVETRPAVIQLAAPFGDAIKSLKSLDSIRAKLDAALAQAKIEVDGRARAIRANLGAYRDAADGFETLFPDLATLLHKAPDDFAAVVAARIAEHKAAEEARARRAAEEATRLAEQQRQKLEAQAEAAAAVGAIAAPGQYPAPTAAPGAASAPAPAPLATSGPAPAATAFAPEPEPASLKLGDINGRIAPLQISAAGMEQLGIRPARTEGASKLYCESDYRRLLVALAKHIEDRRTVVAA